MEDAIFFLGSDRTAINRQLNQDREGVPVTLAVLDGEIRINVSGEAGGARRDVVLVTDQRRGLGDRSRREFGTYARGI